MEYQHLISFFTERPKHQTSLTFFRIVKIALAAPKVFYFDTYTIFFNALSYGRSVEGKNKDSEIMGTIALAVLELSLSYTDPYLLAEFRRIG